MGWPGNHMLWRGSGHSHPGDRMRLVVVLLLLCVWIYLAYDSFQRGQTALGVLFLLIGAALTFWRLRRA